MPHDISEAQTRKKYIDKKLKAAGWDILEVENVNIKECLSFNF